MDEKIRKPGWTIERGAFQNTTDDRSDRWYAYRFDTLNAIDRRGGGYATRREALEAVNHMIEPEA